MSSTAFELINNADFASLHTIFAIDKQQASNNNRLEKQ